jgi:hypothetical protein
VEVGYEERADPVATANVGAAPRRGRSVTLGKSMTTQREGWIDDEYVRIYAASNRQYLAKLYDFPTFLPGYEPWGSWGLDALCLGSDSRLYVLDWIPLEKSFLKERYASVAAFEEGIARLHDATPAYEYYQKEIHFVQPLIFGGDPKIAPVMVDQTTHAEACRFWNKTYRELKDRVDR